MKTFLIVLLCVVVMIGCEERCKHYKVMSASALWPNTTKHIVIIDSMYKVGDTIYLGCLDGEHTNTYVIVEKEGH